MTVVSSVAYWIMPVKASDARSFGFPKFAVPDGLLDGRHGADLDLMCVQRVRCRLGRGNQVEVQFDENGRWRLFPIRNMFHLITPDVHGEGVDFFVKCLLDSGQVYGEAEARGVAEYMRFQCAIPDSEPTANPERKPLFILSMENSEKMNEKVMDIARLERAAVEM